MLGPYDLAVVVVLAVVVLVAVRRGYRTIRAEFRDVKLSVDGIDRAVNQRAHDEPTLYELAKAASLTAAEALTLGHRNHERLEQVAERLDAHLAQGEPDASPVGR